MPRGRPKAVVAEADDRPGLSLQAVSHDDIAMRAFEIYLARGAEGGHALDDWLQAERELADRRTA